MHQLPSSAFRPRLRFSPGVAYGAILAAMVIGIALSLALWQSTAAHLRQAEEAEFRQQAERVLHQVRTQLNQYRSALNSLRGLFLASDEVSREEFARYVAAIDLVRNYPGLRAVALNRYVPGDKAAAFEARTRRELAQSAPYLPPYSIFPPGQRRHYIVSHYIEPFADNARALGKDIYEDPARARAVDYAIRHDFAATSPIGLAQAPNRPAVLLTMPIFQPPLDGPRHVDRLIGVLGAGFVIDTFFETVLDPHAPLQVVVEDWGHVDEGSPARVIYSTCRSGHSCAPRGSYEYDEQIDFGGRLWHLKINALTIPEGSPAQKLSWYLLGTGMALSLLFAGLAASQVRTRIQARQLQDALQERETILRTAPDGLFLVRDGRLIWGNDAFFALIGGNRREQLGQPWTPPLQDFTQLHELEANVAQAIGTGRPFRTEATWLRDDGYAFWCQLSATRANPERPEEGIIWSLQDISTRKAMESRMTHLAHHDPLTNLPNRAALLTEVERVLAQARRRQDGAAVLFIDLDHFKEVNDHHGHDLGDALLVEVAGRLQAAVRDMDLAARLGGDEFVVVAPQLGDPVDASGLAIRLEESLAAPYHIRGIELHTSPSIGISLFPRDGENFDTLLRKADSAMYQAKIAGRDNYQFYQPGTASRLGTD